VKLMPLSQPTSGQADVLGGAECVEAVDEGDADVNFCGLVIRVSGGDAFAEGLEALHLRLCLVPGMITVPPLSSGAAFFANVAEDRVSGDRGRTVIMPKPAILADWDDGRRVSVENGGMPTAKLDRRVREYRGPPHHSCRLGEQLHLGINQDQHRPTTL
jgi:hypothetical protein